MQSEENFFLKKEYKIKYKSKYNICLELQITINYFLNSQKLA